jgi:hypothetical protein
MTSPAPSPTTPLMVTFALEYARHGWHVFPLHSVHPETKRCTCGDQKCERTAKHPRTKHGVDDATIDATKISKWWKIWPSANIGLACGKSGIVVVDVDPRNGGDETFQELEKANGNLPRTPMQLTGGGGVHYLLRRPVSSDTFRGRKLPGGIDIKADGGYVVLAPSTHASGTPYRWDAGYHPDDEPIADIPERWLGILTTSVGGNQSEIAPEDGLLGAAFKAAGWAGQSITLGRLKVQCPWESEHTSGNRFDGSTVVFAPNEGKTTGHFHCAHSHCSSRALKDVLAILPPKALAEARAHCKLPANHQPPPDTEPSPDTGEPWQKSLHLTAEGHLTKAPGNAALLLANLPDWRGAVRYDSFADRIRWCRPAPVLEGMRGPVIGEELADHHIVHAQAWLARHRRVLFSDAHVRGALESAARKYSYNPLQDYLRTLVWDGTPRLETWLATYVGAEQCETNRIIGTWWPISAVARAMDPGCKVDHVMVLKGKQGTKKSSAFIALAGHEWGLESVPPLKDKDAMQALRGKWIAVFSELETIRGAALTLVKDYVTRQWDTFRPSFGHYTQDVARACVFGGTANETYCLPQDDENRRWWPVLVGAVDIEAIERDRDQLWAEAYHLWANGERWYPETDEHKALLAEAQDESTEQDDWIEPIIKWLTEVVDDQVEHGVSTREAAHRAICIPFDRITRYDNIRIGKILRSLGYIPKYNRLTVGRERRYYPGPETRTNWSNTVQSE